MPNKTRRLHVIEWHFYDCDKAVKLAVDYALEDGNIVLGNIKLLHPDQHLPFSSEYRQTLIDTIQRSLACGP